MVVNLTLIALVAGLAGQSVDEINTVPGGVRYRLLPGSEIINREAENVWRPLGGTLVVRTLSSAPTVTVLGLEQIAWNVQDGGPPLDVRGGGWWLLDFEPPVSRALKLDLGFNQSDGGHFVSYHVDQTSRLPTLVVNIDEDRSHGYGMRLIAEPVRGLSFSTGTGFTSTQLGAVSDGDLLAARGAIVKTNADLTEHLGIMPVAPDIGLDAHGLTPATESILFSGELDVFSESLGLLQQGDLLNIHGFVMQANAELTAAYNRRPGAPDVGLDAYHMDLLSGEQWFSTDDSFWAENSSTVYSSDDLLSDAGTVVKTNAELLEHFAIVNPDSNGYGLDAVTRLPNGTIWFSVERGFVDARLGPIGPGDVLSDSGHLIRRNGDLLEPFEPMEDLDDFGLDALQAGSVVAVVDFNADGRVDLDDYAALRICLGGPGMPVNSQCAVIDLDLDGAVTMADYAAFERVFAPS